MHFGLLSRRKLHFRSLKTDLFENSLQSEDFQKLRFQCSSVDIEKDVKQSF